MNRFKAKHLIADNSGQALVEYILILVVSVAIILGVLYQFNDAFRKFAENYFGNYLACLLETGELPAVGSEDGGTGVCADQMRKFNLADGKPLPLSGGSGGTTTQDQARRAPIPPASRVASESSGSSGGGSSGAPSVNSFMKQGGRPESAPVAASPGAKGTSEDSGGTEFESRPMGVRFAGQGGSGKETSTAVDARSAGALEEAVDKGRPPKKAMGEAANETLKARVSKEPERLRGPATAGEEGEPLSFGDWLRWLIIAAIIIALIVFLGGQAMQISKSWEKS